MLEGTTTSRQSTELENWCICVEGKDFQMKRTERSLPLPKLWCVWGKVVQGSKAPVEKEKRDGHLGELSGEDAERHILEAVVGKRHDYDVLP